MKTKLKDVALPGSEFLVRNSAEDPVLLILDGHSTHTKNISFIENARENYTTVVCSPPTIVISYNHWMCILWHLLSHTTFKLVKNSFFYSLETTLEGL